MIRDNFTLECIRIFTTNIDKLFYVTIINSYLFTRVVRQTNGRICKMINTSIDIIVIVNKLSEETILLDEFGRILFYIRMPYPVFCLEYLAKS